MSDPCSPPLFIAHETFFDRRNLIPNGQAPEQREGFLLVDVDLTRYKTEISGRFDKWEYGRGGYMLKRLRLEWHAISSSFSRIIYDTYQAW
jgi:hypothetical protein